MKAQDPTLSPFLWRKSPKSPLCKDGSCGGTRELTKSAPGRISCAKPNSLALTSTVWKQNQQQVSILPFVTW